MEKVIWLEGIAFMLLILFIGIIIMVNAFYRSAKKKTLQSTEVCVRPNLGIADHDQQLKQQLTTLVRYVEQALDSEYVEQIKDRVIREQEIHEQEWENRWFEWKRICLLTLICKEIPLYSREVDEIWNEAASIPEPFEDLSQKLIGQKRFPRPALPKDEMKQKNRAWFDFLYTLVFVPTWYSQLTYGDFFKYPLSKEVTHDFSVLTTEQLLEKYFQNEWNAQVPKLEETLTTMIHYLKELLQSFTGKSFDQITEIASKKGQHQELFIKYLYLSVYEYEQFANKHRILSLHREYPIK